MKKKHVHCLKSCDKASLVRREGSTKGLWELRVRAAERCPASQLLDTSPCRAGSLWAVRAAETSSLSVILRAKLRRDLLPSWAEIRRSTNVGSCSALPSGFIASFNDQKPRRAVAVSHIYVCYFRSAEKLSRWVLKATGWYPVGSLHQLVNILRSSAKTGTQGVVADVQQNGCKAWRWEPQDHKRGVCGGHQLLHPAFTNSLREAQRQMLLSGIVLL